MPFDISLLKWFTQREQWQPLSTRGQPSPAEHNAPIDNIPANVTPRVQSDQTRDLGSNDLALSRHSTNELRI